MKRVLEEIFCALLIGGVLLLTIAGFILPL